MEVNELLTILTSVLVLVNTAQVILAAVKKLKPEVKKMDAEAESEAMETANLSLDSAQKGILILQNRLDDLQKHFEQEKSAWRIELDKEKELRRSELQAEKDARRKETDYLKRRMKESERESRDYRSWAARLVKQVTELGGSPVPLILTVSEDSETGIPAIENGKKEEKK